MTILRGALVGRFVDEQLAADFAHVLRRVTFGPFPGQVERALESHRDADGLIAGVLEAKVLQFDPRVDAPGLPDEGAIDLRHPPPDDDLRYYVGFRPWWMKRMRSDEAGLHDKLMWFWHSHFTSSFQKVDNTNMCWAQLSLFHEHALGNFGDMVKAFTEDRAMLRYLDGDGSDPEHPNENYARELMELFTLGFDQFTQSDVVVAAGAFAGWRIDQSSQLVFDGGSRASKPETFLGVTKLFAADDVVDAILGRKQCATFVVEKLWSSFVGGRPKRETVERLATTFRQSGYELRPLMEDLLMSEEFRTGRHARARVPVEWHCAVVRATGDTDVGAEGLDELGQLPYAPPTPAGWPGDEAWLSSTHAHAKARFLSTLSFPAASELAQRDDLVEAVVQRLALYEIASEEREALVRLAGTLAQAGVADDPRAAAVLAAAAMTPTFSLA